MITLKNVNKYFNRGKKNQIHVINNTTLTLEDNGLVALLGPSGCGKTTLLNTIGGLDKVKKGSIYINNKKINSIFNYKRDKIRNMDIGYIFQDYKLIENMTVYDNIKIVLKMIGLKDNKEINKRILYVLEKVGMLRYKYRLCSMLSGGEKQRVGIARAIVKDPNIILADEPTGNLDSKNSLEIMKIIKSISKDKLVILVTHEQELAKFYASRIIEIEDGKVIKDYENNKLDDLDYMVDNTFYLKDFKINNSYQDENLDLKIYKNKEEKIKLDIVIKNNNIYIKCNNKERVELVDEDTNITFINDNYKKIAKKDIDTYKFDFNNIINNNYKKKYTSIFNPITSIINGFKKVFDFSILKKILLLGFVLSGMFVVYGVTSITSTFKIEDTDFISKDKNYLTLVQKKINVEDYIKYEQNKNIKYMMPGDTFINFELQIKDFYQLSLSSLNLEASINSLNILDEKNIILGTYPKNKNEVVLDKLVVERMIKQYPEYNMYGIKDYKDILNRTLTINNMDEFKIVGITNDKIPTIYINENRIINTLYNLKKSQQKLVDYNLYKDSIEIKKGNLPLNDYEIIVNINNQYTMPLNKEIESKVNDTKLKVVGYYESTNNYDYYFTNQNTIKYDLITLSQNISIYTYNKNDVINEFKLLNLNIKDDYNHNKNEYIKSNQERNKSTILICSIILIISFVEMYLISRSSFLTRIKEIGILRAIGVKKNDIYKMFYGEIFAITTLTSLPGCILMSYILYTIGKISFLKDMFIVNIYTIILSIFSIYIFNLIVGLIPVFNVVRKTPASILSRHDLD